MHDLAKLIEDAAATYAESTFLMFPEGKGEVRSLPYRQFGEAVRRWACFLKEQGVKPGDRVGFITPKSPYQVLAFYASWWLGAIAVPVCEALGDLEMGFIIRDSEPTLMLTDRSMQKKVAANSGDIPQFQFDDLPGWDGADEDLPRHANESDDVAALIYTSGSTGMPKGVMLTHRNLQVNGTGPVEAYDVRKGERIISLLPYWHSYALVYEVIAIAIGGATTVISKDMRDFRRNIPKYQPTIMLVVPRIADSLKAGIEKGIADSSPKVQALFQKATYNASRIFTAGPRLDGGMLRILAHHAFYDPVVFRKIRKNFGGQLRFFMSGGAPLDMDSQIFFKYIGIPMFQGYGLTESSPAISSDLPGRHKVGSAGPLWSWLLPESGGDWTLKDESGTLGKDLKGELLVKGDCVMKGYWRHQDKSAKALVDGWLHTGDMGYVDEEGFLFLDGRQGNMIVLFGGEKLHPEHIEEEVKQCPLVTECMVIGEKCKNVYVAVNVDSDLAEGMTPDELKAQLKKEVAERTKHLAAYQKPKELIVLPEWSPDDGTLTVTLKIRRHKIWETYGRELREFLAGNGEEGATREDVSIASSKIMESLGRQG
ncbi:MAG: AMP-binding protein [Victivallales bacterium]|nr:AMP-binding protein [Victivallales bacterium]